MARANPELRSAVEEGGLMSGRKNYADSCVRLMQIGVIDPPPMPERMPHIDDEEPLGVTFYKSGLEDADASGLTIPRTFFGRSRISRTSFANSDLSESSLCWNDFSDVLFDGANLACCDMRASDFERVSFRQADLSGADLRRSNFDGCNFSDANMRGVVLTNDQGQALSLSSAQKAQIAWTDDPGDEPDGG